MDSDIIIRPSAPSKKSDESQTSLFGHDSNGRSSSVATAASSPPPTAKRSSSSSSSSSQAGPSSGSSSVSKREKGPSRRKHKNSKNGCPNCKKRRVKCTEDLPACSNCVKHKAHCGYLDYTEDQLQELKVNKRLFLEIEAKTIEPIAELSISGGSGDSGDHSPTSESPQKHTPDRPQASESSRRPTASRKSSDRPDRPQSSQKSSGLPDRPQASRKSSDRPDHPLESSDRPDHPSLESSDRPDRFSRDSSGLHPHPRPQPQKYQSQNSISPATFDYTPINTPLPSGTSPYSFHDQPPYNAPHNDTSQNADAHHNDTFQSADAHHNDIFQNTDLQNTNLQNTDLQNTDAFQNANPFQNTLQNTNTFQQSPSQPPHPHQPGHPQHTGVNDVFNFHSNITQDFHNLLPTNAESDGQIIYPVYSINNEANDNNNSSFGPYNAGRNQNFRKNRDVFGWVTNSQQQMPDSYGESEQFESAGDQLMMDYDAQAQLFDANDEHQFPHNQYQQFSQYEQQNMDSSIPSYQTPGINYGMQTQAIATPAVLHSATSVSASSTPTASYSGYGASLPQAITKQSHFTVLSKPDINYGEELSQYITLLSPKILVGRATLPEIRVLYNLWLNSFIYRSYSSKIMFSCLTNLTTNYLISNVLGGKINWRASFGDLVDQTRLKNILIVKSIKHYAIVIKVMRHLLKNNEESELCAQVSYILSLMSIYDPEATLNSTNCFRDGLFGILSHTLNHCAQSGVEPPKLVPIHLHLMSNVSRSIYLPGYNPQFLHEFQSMLISFGNIIRMIKLQIESNNRDPSGNATLKFVELMYNELMKFCNDSIKNYIPTITENLSNIDIQQRTMFIMAHRWVRLQESRLTIMNLNNDPLEKILYLFYKVFKKSVFAIAPQVKYFFLRDFDSPLMLDVFSVYDDYSIYDEELDSPRRTCVPGDIYGSVKVQLKILSSYLIRLSTFLETRLRLLYKTIVYEGNTKQLFPITNVKQWRSSITDIEQVRRDFYNKIGLVETPVVAFGNTVLRPEHYPRVVNPDAESYKVVNPESYTVSPVKADEVGRDNTSERVDFLTLQRPGLLVNDYTPQM